MLLKLLRLVIQQKTMLSKCRLHTNTVLSMQKIWQNYQFGKWYELMPPNFKKEQEQEAAKEEKIERKNIVEKTKTPTVKKKRSFKENQEFQNIENEIAELENEKCELEAFFSSGECDPQKIKDANLRYENLCTTLENKYSRWEELAAMEE